MSIPKTCKAAVLVEYGKPYEIRDVQVPQELEPGAMLVKIDVATICGSDVHHWSGKLSANMPADLPAIPGHKMVGEIVAFGPDHIRKDSVGQDLNLGDRIMFTHETCAEHCYTCTVQKRPQACRSRRYYMTMNCEKPPYLTGAFAEYMYVFPRSGTVKVPDGVKSSWASGASCAFRSVLNGFAALDATGKSINYLDTVVIQGAGPLGLFSTAVCSVAGAKKIIVIGAPDNRLEIARRWGAQETISIEEYPSAATRQSMVMEMTQGRGADAVVEVSGFPGAFIEGMGLLGNGGRYVVLGQVGGKNVEFDPSIVTKKNATIVGAWSAHIDSYYKSMVFMDKWKDRFDFDAMFSKPYSLNQINDAIQNMRKAVDIKPVIKM